MVEFHVLSAVFLVIGLACLGFAAYRLCSPSFTKKAVRYAVTLKNNEGAFLALCIKRHRGTWVFVDVKITPNTPGGPVIPAAPGELYVPTRNILYYQEIEERTANATE